ncbi:MAG TPA: hypothetical protein P5266_07670, partial [Candidatus Fermentibacter sp.]|nr:hypothetical protein [Candidatus Fermentibacter sp.]
MRNLLAAILFISIASVSAGDLRLEDESFSTIAYIREDGRIEDASFCTLGYIRDESRIEDASFSTLGYIRDGRIEGPGFNTMYYLEDDGRLTDSSFSLVLTIQSDGTVKACLSLPDVGSAGTLRATPLAELWRGAALAAWRR